MSRKTLAGKRVAITGGAHGIGRETALAFLTAGADVVLGDVDVGAVRAAAEQLGRSHGGTVIGLALDVTDGARFGSFLTCAERKLDGLDVVVNAADVLPAGLFRANSEAEPDLRIDVDLRAVTIGTRMAAERFAGRGHGQVVNIGTAAGVTAALGVAVYCATRHGVAGLGAALDQELSGTGVILSTVAPGSHADHEAVADAVVDCVRHRRGGLINVPPAGALRTPGGFLRHLFTREGQR
ncbi:SDR family NAD(P)-dependent oxidoreductase [Nocardia sp. NPDC006044]|uniref:SDR family NAD(P)-dependent oxidoreductase n=1 Tax=Nocardia sp. NPDC006044 TaxID=3364306 RepID=UPI0036BCF3EF